MSMTCNQSIRKHVDRNPGNDHITEMRLFWFSRSCNASWESPFSGCLQGAANEHCRMPSFHEGAGNNGL
eukprot:4328107-Amphidinium_carterae.2